MKRACKHCGEKFDGNSRKTYCGNACRAAAWRHRVGYMQGGEILRNDNRSERNGENNKRSKRERKRISDPEVVKKTQEIFQRNFKVAEQAKEEVTRYDSIRWAGDDPWLRDGICMSCFESIEPAGSCWVRFWTGKDKRTYDECVCGHCLLDEINEGELNYWDDRLAAL